MAHHCKFQSPRNALFIEYTRPISASLQQSSNTKGKSRASIKQSSIVPEDFDVNVNAVNSL